MPLSEKKSAKRPGKPPPPWFSELLKTKMKRQLTRADVAEALEISINAVNQAYKRYQPPEYPGMKTNNGRLIKYCSSAELKKMAKNVLDHYYKSES